MSPMGLILDSVMLNNYCGTIDIIYSDVICGLGHMSVKGGRCNLGLKNTDCTIHRGVSLACFHPEGLWAHE